jgi:hypothetical protein
MPESLQHPMATIFDVAGSRLAVENSRFLSADFILPQDPAFTGIFHLAEREGLLGASRLAPSGPP